MFIKKIFKKILFKIKNPNTLILHLNKKGYKRSYVDLSKLPTVYVVDNDKILCKLEFIFAKIAAQNKDVISHKVNYITINHMVGGWQQYIDYKEL